MSTHFTSLGTAMGEHPVQSLPHSLHEIERLILDIVSAAAASELVLVGDGAVLFTFDNPPHRPTMLELSASTRVYPKLRQLLYARPGWVEATHPATGKPYLTNTLLEISMEWDANLPHSSLQELAWRTPLGLNVAHLAHVCNWRLAQGDSLYADPNAVIRRRLHDEAQPPLPQRVLTRELNLLYHLLPDSLRNDPDAEPAIHLAANGLLTVFALYGDPSIRRAGQIVGELEKPQYQVSALYHNGFDLPNDITGILRHLTLIDATPKDKLDAVVAVAYADAVYGNGRESNRMPGGHDELRSARLLQAHARFLRFDDQRAARLFSIVDATCYNETTRQQKGLRHADPVARALAGIDLSSLAKPSVNPLELCFEDLMSARFSSSRTLGKVLAQYKTRLASLAEGIAFVDAHADERPADAPDGPTIRQAMVRWLEANAQFHESHMYPADWTLDNIAVRRQNAAKLRQLAALVAARRWGIQEAYEHVSVMHVPAVV